MRLSLTLVIFSFSINAFSSEYCKDYKLAERNAVDSCKTYLAVEMVSSNKKYDEEKVLKKCWCAAKRMNWKTTVTLGFPNKPVVYASCKFNRDYADDLINNANQDGACL